MSSPQVLPMSALVITFGQSLGVYVAISGERFGKCLGIVWGG